MMERGKYREVPFTIDFPLGIAGMASRYRKKGTCTRHSRLRYISFPNLRDSAVNSAQMTQVEQSRFLHMSNFTTSSLVSTIGSGLEAGYRSDGPCVSRCARYLSRRCLLTLPLVNASDAYRCYGNWLVPITDLVLTANCMWA